jgi:hypothetical protein
LSNQRHEALAARSALAPFDDFMRVLRKRRVFHQMILQHRFPTAWARSPLTGEGSHVLSLSCGTRYGRARPFQPVWIFSEVERGLEPNRQQTQAAISLVDRSQNS